MAIFFCQNSNLLHREFRKISRYSLSITFKSFIKHLFIKHILYYFVLFILKHFYLLGFIKFSTESSIEKERNKRTNIFSCQYLCMGK